MSTSTTHPPALINAYLNDAIRNNDVAETNTMIGLVFDDLTAAATAAATAAGVDASTVTTIRDAVAAHIAAHYQR